MTLQALPPGAGSARAQLMSYLWWGLFAAVLITVVAIRVRLLGIPLERDEGEYAYAGQLLLRGIPPYALAYGMKFPGTYVAFAGIMALGGQSPSGIHLGLLVVNVTTVALVILIGRRLVNMIAGLASGMSFAVISIGSPVLGLAAHATNFVMLFALAGLFVLFIHKSRLNRNWLLLSGGLFGLAILMKQPAVWFALGAFACVACTTLRRKEHPLQSLISVASFAAGVAFPLIVCAFWLWRAGVWSNAILWTVRYAREYAGVADWTDALQLLRHNGGRVIQFAPVLWLGAASGIVLCLGRRSIRHASVPTLTFGLAALFAVSAGLYFRPHYFVMLVGPGALFTGFAIAALDEFATRRAVIARILVFCLFTIVIATPLFRGREFFFGRSPDEACKILHGESPFVEAIQVASFIQSNTRPYDHVAVLGSEPELCFYAHRLSVTGYIYMYPLMEPQKYAAEMQERMIYEIERGQPEVMVMVASFWSWLQRPTSGTRLIEWADQYLAEHYYLIGSVQLDPDAASVYHLPDTSGRLASRSNYVAIYRRR